MTINLFLRALAVGTFLLLAAPMSNAAVNPPSPAPMFQAPRHWSRPASSKRR